MWIVQLALKRPHTFIVLAVLLLILGPLAILRMPTDIFPAIDIPVVSIVWSYNGLSAEEMAQRITGSYERALTSDVENIEHIESQTYAGTAVVKVTFHPGADITRAVAQASTSAQSLLKVMPPGTLPPLVLTYSASTVPILQLAFSSDSLGEQQLYDLGNTAVRTQLATIQGASVPLPFGGKVRQVMVDLDPRRLQAHGLTPADVVNAVNAQNLALPGGTAKIGAREYDVRMNGSADSIAALGRLPVRDAGGNAVVRVDDVASVRDGYVPQTNIVRRDGRRAALLQVEKSGSASTLTIIAQAKAKLAQLRATLPAALQVQQLGDQSVFVSSAIQGVIREGAIAAALTAVMILLFLGSWRATLIIAVSIPLAVLASMIALAALGETLNIMTLGGLALAVGILVDDATVAIENITHHLERGQPMHEAILVGSGEIAAPTLISTLCICIVFLPMFMLGGVARYLFVPLAEAVVFAMAASYLLSRTLVPTLAMYWMRVPRPAGAGAATGPFARLGRWQRGFEHRFERLRAAHGRLLGRVLAQPGRVAAGVVLAVAASLALFAFAGRDFFPTVDTGEIRLHARAPSGTRIEETARLVDEVEHTIRATLPADQFETVLDDIGLPVSGINLTYATSGAVGSSDAEILITLTRRHDSTPALVARLRQVLVDTYPQLDFAFLPADIVSQILNFGLPAPIDIQVSGNNLAADQAVARRLLARVRGVPGVVDARVQQPSDLPVLHVQVDRDKAIQSQVLQRDAAQNLLIALSGSAQTAPNFWVDPKNGVSYPVTTMVPQADVDSLDALGGLPLGDAVPGTGGVSAPGVVLNSLGEISRGAEQAVVSHADINPVIDVYAGVQGRDLGAVAGEIDRVLADERAHLPPGTTVAMRGQVQSMQASFSGLLSGLAFAVVLVYLLMVVNFQSWLDPLVIVCGLPASLAGIAWMLFVTQTTVSVPALTGTILCMGIATANSILVVNTARELLAAGRAPLEAALEAASSRFRPVVMTALAMLIGMVPMALGLGDGGEQNAPLGRAVIGGLAAGTASTLLFVPLLFAMLHGWLAQRRPSRAHSLVVA
jgi:multidrug efflux pump subunit AcrB